MSATQINPANLCRMAEMAWKPGPILDKFHEYAAQWRREQTAMQAMRAGLQEIAGMTFDSWTNGAKAQEIAVALLALTKDMA